MKWEYVCDVICDKDYDNIVIQFVGKKVTKQEVEKCLLEINPKIKELDLQDGYENFLTVLTENIEEDL